MGRKRKKIKRLKVNFHSRIPDKDLLAWMRTFYMQSIAVEMLNRCLFLVKAVFFVVKFDKNGHNSISFESREKPYVDWKYCNTQSFPHTTNVSVIPKIFRHVRWQHQSMAHAAVDGSYLCFNTKGRMK